tara:strand:+ start:187 stop:333 length:147 start_codon:yes stop_codon:yes gene_type:complete
MNDIEQLEYEHASTQCIYHLREHIDHRPRPECLWPVDALPLAEQLLGD